MYLRPYVARAGAFYVKILVSHTGRRTFSLAATKETLSSAIAEGEIFWGRVEPVVVLSGVLPAGVQDAIVRASYDMYR